MSIRHSFIIDEFENIYETNFDDLYRYFAKRAGEQFSEDLTEEVFTIAVKLHASFRPEKGSPRVWLFGIAHNVLRRHWRLQKYRRQYKARAAQATEAMHEPFEEGVVARVDASRLGQNLAKALTSLPRGQRDVLLLRAWFEFSDAEIATILGIQGGTVRSRLSRARSSLREQLGDSRQVDSELDG
jgi:RNA polymerase sigma-70 factor (ECF subfamily)